MTTAYHRYMPSDGSMRSSSEFTAATIFSMYEDPVVDVQDAPPVPVLDPKYRSGESKYRSGESNKYRSGESTKYGEPSKYHSGENKYHSGESNKYHSGDSNRYSGKYRPESRPLSMVSERSKDANRRSYGALENGRPERFSYTQPQPEPGPSRTYPTRQSSLQPEQAPRTPSPNTTPYPGTSPVSPSLLTPIDRERKTSSKHSIVTSQTNHTTPTSLTEYTTRHSTEDADAFRVRATYARLEAEGVPGDGWLEGVERTRTRVVSAASAAVLEASKGAGGKGANVGAEEEARLRSTDRYGFFSQPAPKHEGRLVLLPALALKTFASPHKPAPIPTPSQLPSTRQLNSLPVPVIDPKEDARIAKWERMLVPATQPGSGGIGGGWKWDARKVRKRTERVFKGVPDRWRSAAWGTLVEEPRQRRRESISQLGARYRELLDAPSEHDVQIDLDVPRTISGHVLFHTRYGQGQRSLFYVLHAFAQLCPSCGYVQGMGPIAATLLNYFEPERCYAILVRLHDEYDMHTIFQPGFPGLLESIYVQEKLIERLMPGVYQALSKHMISSTSFVTKWYITLFANTVPYQTQLRLWDAFLLEGRDVLVIAAVAILWIVKDHITAPQANFETILSLLSSTFVFEDEDALLRWMERLLTDRRLRDEMDGWRAEWGRLEAEGKGGKALL